MIIFRQKKNVHFRTLKLIVLYVTATCCNTRSHCFTKFLNFSCNAQPKQRRLYMMKQKKPLIAQFFFWDKSGSRFIYSSKFFVTIGKKFRANAVTALTEFC